MFHPHDNEVVLRDAEGAWLYFRNPQKILSASTPAAVMPVLEEVCASGGWSAGYVGYEAAPAFDPALPARKSVGPLIWFALYDEPERIVLPESSGGERVEWVCSESQDEYSGKIAEIKKYIADGDSYQVNYTHRLTGRVNDPWQFFLRRMSGARFSTYIQTECRAVCSASPELFFELKGDEITCRPMKGTARDTRCLLDSVKDRAENIMIVDMIRNDLGRICVPGSIVADPLFSVEPFAEIRQMTSTVTGRTGVSVPAVFRALFPCASVTGAPKRRTMQIIRELEDSPRNIYCGAIGYTAPDRRARFSVAIRTAEIDRPGASAVYGVGGGIVWDSRPEQEWAECELKSEFLGIGAGCFSRSARAVCAHPAAEDRAVIRSDFQLLETMLFENGVAFLEEHIERLVRSAGELGFAVDKAEVVRRLHAVHGVRQRLRLLLSRTGDLTLESSPFPLRDEPLRRVCFAMKPVAPDNPLLFHKTTLRELYESAKADFPDMDDVILWNDRGEVTESTFANIVVKIDGELVTPPVGCGLLPGTMRAALLKEGRIRERTVTRGELANAEGFFLINSLRGWMRAELA